MLAMLALPLVMILGGSAGHYTYSENNLKIFTKVLLVVSAA